MSSGRSGTPCSATPAAPDHVVMYCGSGVTACHNLLALEHAGLGGARLFPGSWSEWSVRPDVPPNRNRKLIRTRPLSGG